MNLLAAAIAICLPLATTALNCSCSPTSYTFQFNFSGTCDTSTIKEGNPGIVDTSCGIPQNSDTTPTNITSGRFVEWDVSNNIITNNFTSFAPPITDGGIVSFTSISDTLNTSKPLADQMELVPGRVELVITGVNADNEMVVNFVGWVYNTTNCNVEPLAVGDRIGWLTLVNYTLPKAAFCAAVVTAAPTAPPSKEPTNSPIFPTAAPTAPPSKEPTNSPISTTAAPSVISSKGSKSEGPSAKSAKMAKIEDEIYTEAQKMKSKSHTEMMTKKNFKVVESIIKSSGKDHHNIIMEEDASMSMSVALSFNMMEDDSMSYKARVPSTHVEKSPFGRRNGLRSHEE